MRTLTQPEIDAIAKLTHNTKLDNSFDVAGEDCFEDFDNNEVVDIQTGLWWLCDGLAYPFKHDGLNKEEATLIANLFKEFNICNDAEIKELMEGF